MFGVLNICKPAGITSRDVVNRVQRIIRPAKVGHAGTLDPLATGVLVVCVGPATRLVEYVQGMPKRYVGSFLLGRTSDTEDVEGEVTELSGVPQPSRDQIESLLPQFVGEIMQRPPAFSALKVKGRRAYQLARQGAEVKLEARPVTVYDLALLDYQYPEMTLEVTCGGGTYVRSLGRDIGQALGSGAVMATLKRTRIGPFDIHDAWPPEQLTREQVAQRLLPAIQAVDQLPKVALSDQQIADIRQGRVIGGTMEPGAATAAGINTNGQLVALLASGPSEGSLRAFRVFVE